MPCSAQELSNLIEDIYAAGFDTGGDGWTRVCERLAHAIAAQGSVALGLQRGRLSYAAAHAVGLDRDSLVRYQAYYAGIDPVFEPRLRHAPAGTMLLSDAIMPPGELRRTEFGADWLRPHGFDAGLAAVLVRHGSAESILYVARPIDRGSFTREEIETAGLLLPHLSGAVRVSLRLAELDAARNALEHALDRWAQAVVLVDSGGRVHAANRAAEALLRLDDGVAVERSRDFGRGQLCAAGPGATKSLHRLIEIAASIAARHAAGPAGLPPGGPLTMMLERPSRRPPLAVLITPLAPRARASGALLLDLDPGGSRPLVAVFILDPSVDEGAGSATKALLREAYRLTPAETEVAVALATGDGLRAVAAAHGVTLATVRTQAQQVYRKTSVRGQAGLARLVGRLGHVQ
jgi:DNA-binding CsgD family transcriptional regulator/PAS domain-containing protein